MARCCAGLLGGFRGGRWRWHARARLTRSVVGRCAFFDKARHRTSGRCGAVAMMVWLVCLR